MTWLAFGIVGVLFITITLYAVFVNRAVITKELTDWVFWISTILTGSAGGLNGLKTFLQARTGVVLPNGGQGAVVTPSKPAP